MKKIANILFSILILILFYSCEKDELNKSQVKQPFYEGLTNEQISSSINNFKDVLMQKDNSNSIDFYNGIEYLEALYNYDFGFNHGTFISSKTLKAEYEIGVAPEYISYFELFEIYKDLNNEIFEQYKELEIEDKKINSCSVQYMEEEGKIAMIVIVGSFQVANKQSKTESNDPFFYYQNISKYLEQDNHSYAVFYDPIIWWINEYSDSEATSQIESDLVINNYLEEWEFFYDVETVWATNIPYTDYYIYNDDILEPGYSFNDSDEYPSYLDKAFPALVMYFGDLWNGHIESYYNADYKRMNKYWNIICAAIGEYKPQGKVPISYDFSYWFSFVQWEDNTFYTELRLHMDYGSIGVDPMRKPKVPMNLE